MLRFLLLGVEHILTGADHLLLLLGLLLLVRDRWTLLEDDHAHLPQPIA